MTQRTVTALLVGRQDGCLPKLKMCLEDLGVKTSHVERPGQVRRRLRAADPPEVIFAATGPADNTWSDVVKAAHESGKQPVILASRVVDVAKYLEALEQGAFDFVVPPFAPRDIRQIVDCAIEGSRV
jgi:DNA-binding NtrC family response regulator